MVGALSTWVRPGRSLEPFPYLAGVLPETGVAGGGIAGPVILALGILAVAAAALVLTRRPFPSDAVATSIVVVLVAGAVVGREVLRRLSFAEAMLPGRPELGPGPWLSGGGLVAVLAGTVLAPRARRRRARSPIPPELRRALVGGFAALLIGSAVLFLGPASPGDAAADAGPLPQTGPPNIVVIVTDDQRADTLWAMPNVRELLADEGVTFTNAFATTPFCCPSRASILSGQYSRHTGVIDGQYAPGGGASFRDGSSLATWLDDAGYDTALVGKYLNAFQADGVRYVPPGWDHWDALVSEPMVRYHDYVLSRDGRLELYGRSPQDYSTTALGDIAAGFVERTRGPFFLYYAPVAAHLPAVPAPQDEGAFDDLDPHTPPSVGEDVSDKPWAGEIPDGGPDHELVRLRQLQTLLAVDRAVAGIVDAVERRGGLDRTVFVFTSDNGMLWGEHELHGKVWPYEESLRVPLVIRAPGAAAGATDPHPVLNIDIAPTLAEFARVTPGIEVDGASLVPLLREPGADLLWRTEFVAEFLGNVGPPGLPRYSAVRTEDHLYVEYENGWRELYDLTSDPYQIENLAGEPGSAALERELAGRLAALLSA